MDIFYLNGLKILHTDAGKINFLTVELLTSRGEKPFIRALEKIKTKYDTIGFKITGYHGDNEFNTKTFKIPYYLFSTHKFQNKHIGII